MTTARNRRARHDARRQRGTALAAPAPLPQRQQERNERVRAKADKATKRARRDQRAEKPKAKQAKKQAPNPRSASAKRRVEGASHCNSLYDEKVDQAMRDGNGGKTILFVYGTLKGGHALDSLLPYPRIPATVKGRLYFVSSGGGYPVLDVKQDGWVRGELVVVPNTKRGLGDLLDTLRMEEHAGYDIEEVDAVLPNSHLRRRVLVCAWNQQRRGERIDGTLPNLVDGDRTEDAADFVRPRRVDWAEPGPDEWPSDDLDDDEWADFVADTSPDGYHPSYLDEEAEVRVGRELGADLGRVPRSMRKGR